MLIIFGGGQLNNLNEFLQTGPTTFAFIKRGLIVDMMAAGAAVVKIEFVPSMPSTEIHNNEDSFNAFFSVPASKFLWIHTVQLT